MAGLEALQDLKDKTLVVYDEDGNEDDIIKLGDEESALFEIIEKDLKVLENIKSKKRMLYSRRKEMAKEFDKWCIDNKLENCSENMATWFLAIKLKEWLNGR